MREACGDVGIVLIGRNEGERFVRCLDSIAGACGGPVIYVDSGSTDGSVACAAARGVTVVALDTAIPFSMGRARNEGVAELNRMGGYAFVQFVDGDCAVDPEWIPTARAFLLDHPEIAAVCGRRRELFPGNSVYNRICDIEWNTALGEAASTGGDALFRMSDFAAVGGFDPELIAGEEPELCFRVRKRGRKIYRLDAPMTFHDAAILHFHQWRTRMVRGGYGAAASHARSGGGPMAPFASQIRSALIWGGLWPLLTAASLLFGILVPGYPSAAAAVLLAAVGGLQILKIAYRGILSGMDPSTAILRALLLFTGKMSQCRGLCAYHRDRLLRRKAHIIEYGKG